MSRRAEGSTRIAAAAVFAVLVIVALLAGPPPASEAGRGAACKGPGSLGSFFELGRGGKVATRRTSCAKGKAVAKRFGRSCERAYTAQGKCRIRAGGKWRCRSRMTGGIENGAPARVKCRKRKGRVSFVVGWFPPVEPSLDPAPGATLAAGSLARAPSPAWNAGAKCIEAATPGMDVDPPAGANFRIRVVSKLATSLEFGNVLQQSLLNHNVWNLLHGGLASFPRNEPGRLPIILTRGSLPGNAYGLMTWNCSDDSTDAILVRGASAEDIVNETGAHELFHAFSRGRGAALNPDWQRTWWEEASAEWFQWKAGYGEDDIYDNNLQYPNVALDQTPEEDPKTYAYAMSRFVQFLDDQGYVVSGSGWPLQRLVIDGYPAATESLDQVLRAQGTTLGREAAAFWGDRIRETPSHAAKSPLVVGADGTSRYQIKPGSDTVPVVADRLHTKMIEFLVDDDVSRVELEFHNEPSAYFWAAVEKNRSVPVGDNETLSFCVGGEGTNGELEWPVTLPVTFTNGSLATGQLNGEIQVRAQRDPGQCKTNEVPGNRACQVLAGAGVSDLFGSGLYPFFNSSQTSQYNSWLCFYEGDGTEVNLNLFHYRQATTRQVRNAVERQIQELNLRKVKVGDLAGIGTDVVDGKPAIIMTIASGREIIFLIVGPSSDQDRTIRLGKRIVGQID